MPAPQQNRRAGLRHDRRLRRACAAHRWQAGAHPLELQLLLGHTSLKTLCQYLRATTAELFTPYKETKHETAAIA